jgi:serine/threonine protein kinase
MTHADQGSGKLPYPVYRSGRMSSFLCAGGYMGSGRQVMTGAAVPCVATLPWLVLQATIETWMLLEYADRGSLEEAIQNRRFQRKSDKSQLDMVRPVFCMSCLVQMQANTVHAEQCFAYCGFPSCMSAYCMCQMSNRSLNVEKVGMQLSVFRTLLDIVSGMQYLHSLGLVHGELTNRRCHFVAVACI